MQRSSIPNLETIAAFPAGYLYNPCRHSMALDSFVLYPELPSFMAGLCSNLVADSLHPRRLRSPTSPRFPDCKQMDSLCHEHPQFHQLLPIFHRNSTYHRIRRKIHHRGMSRSNIHHVHPEYFRSYDPGFHGRHSLREDEQTQAKNSDPPVLEKRCHLSKRWSFMPDVSGR